MRSVHGKVAAITGAGSGIGRALALDLAGRGCRLALSDIDPEGLARTGQLVQTAGAACTTAVVDVADRAAVQAWADACVREHGRVHLLFNNAGVALAAPAATVRIEDFEWLMGINFWGVVHGTQAFLPHLRASGDGHVVNISSLFGLMAMPTQAAYNASKFAVRGFTEALRMELEIERACVSATCVHPGGIATNIVRSQRIDPAMAQAAGMTAEALRARGQKLIDRTLPEEAARQILAGVERNARRVVIGSDARGADLLVRLLGAAYQTLVVRKAQRLRSGSRGPHGGG